MKFCTGAAWISVVISLMMMPPAMEAAAQEGYPLPPPPASDSGQFTAEQLEQMLAPIALYPDPLLAQILMAATYPLQIVEADRWLQENANVGLQGADLAAAIDRQPWDPSVKSLVPFPQILRMMDAHISWTQELGEAFLADQAAVMDAVQRLRRLAMANGMLTSSPQQLISEQDSVISILTPSPQIVYVPVYDPDVVYGIWPYPNYPPSYFPGFFNVAVIGGVGIGWFGIGIYGPLWGWGHWDWQHHHIDIDRDRFNTLNVRGRPVNSGVWRHEGPAGRGAAGGYPRYPAARQTAEDRRAMRGYPSSPQPQGTLSIIPGPGEQSPQSFSTFPGHAAAQPPKSYSTFPGHATAQPPKSYSTFPGHAAAQSPKSYSTFPGHAAAQPPKSYSTFSGHAGQPPRSFSTFPGHGATSVPPAFESFGQGADIRAQDVRGRASRRSMQNLMQRGGGRRPSATAPGRRRH
jgi:Protein of unknown function (DUF3300)